MKQHVIILYCGLAFLAGLLQGCAPVAKSDSGQSTSGTLSAAGPDLCREAQSGKMWHTVRSGPFTTPQEAEQYVRELRHAGFDDWRLPTEHELLNLHYAFYWSQNGDCDMNTRGEYWYKSEFGETAPGHWETYELCSPEFKFVKSSKSLGYVRAIRP